MRKIEVPPPNRTLGLTRSTYYGNCNRHVPKRGTPNPDEALTKLVDTIFTEHPIYGSRKMIHEIRKHTGLNRVSRKRVSRIMRLA